MSLSDGWWIKIPKRSDNDDTEKGNFENPFYELEIEKKEDDTYESE